jgi:uncharacterized protein YjiS (DUF1127 family)
LPRSYKRGNFPAYDWFNDDNWRKYRQAVSELGRMTNRELNDLGIARDDVPSVARAAVAH